MAGKPSLINQMYIKQSSAPKANIKGLLCEVLHLISVLIIFVYKAIAIHYDYGVEDVVEVNV